MATTVVEKLHSEQDGSDRFHKLFRRYEARTRKGVADGYLFFNDDQIIEHTIKMALWHLKMEQEVKQ